MRATDTHCKTCGAEYKNNPLVFFVIFLIVFGVVFAGVYLFLHQDKNAAKEEDVQISEAKKTTPTNWVIEDSTDKMTDKKSYYLFNQAKEAETGKSVDAGVTIGCSYNGSLNGVFTSDTPIKTKDITKNGPYGEYSIRFDDKPMEYGGSDLSSLNRVVVLSQEHLQQIETSKRTLLRITTGVDSYRTFEINTENGADSFKKIKEFCEEKSKQNKAP